MVCLLGLKEVIANCIGYTSRLLELNKQTKNAHKTKILCWNFHAEKHCMSESYWQSSASWAEAQCRLCVSDCVLESGRVTAQVAGHLSDLQLLISASVGGQSALMSRLFLPVLILRMLFLSFLPLCRYSHFLLSKPHRGN